MPGFRRLKVALVCVFLAGAIILLRWWFCSPKHIHPLVLYSAALTFAIFLFLSISSYWAEIRRTFLAARGLRLFVPVLALIALAVASISLTEPSTSDQHILSKPGVLFVLAMAIVTLIGFILTLSKLEEIHGRILDYPALIERCEEIARLEFRRVHEKRRPGRVTIFANAAGFGNVSAEREFAGFKHQLKALLPHSSVDVTLVSKSWVDDKDGDCDLARFYRAHWPGYPTIEEKINESKTVIAMAAPRPGCRNDQKRLYRLKEEVDEVPFHLFMTSDRAIVFTALRFPQQPRAANTAMPIEESDDTHIAKRVQIIGFETGDRGILRSLEEAVEARLGRIAERETAIPDVEGVQ